MDNKNLIKAQRELIDLYETQIADLVMMSKIELGDDVIEEIRRIKSLITLHTISEPKEFKCEMGYKDCEERGYCNGDC